MNGQRIGRAIRALRHRRDWTQTELGRRAGCSGSVISRLERGNVRACSFMRLERILEALDARLVAYIDWRGGELDRLLDADHSLLQERWALRKAEAGRWQSAHEVTYNHYGERGSIDDLAFDPETGTLLVSELKTGIFDAGRMLMKIDEKVRVAADAARRFGWSAKRVVPCLVVSESSTNRRRITAHAALFARFDSRGRGALAWLKQPDGSVGGLLLFVPLSDVRGMHGRRAGRQRVRPSGAAAGIATLRTGRSATTRGA
jgi:transcriptional regulator with XRE-family HTH domain